MSKFDFYQLFELKSSTYTYIIADKKTKEAVVIDSAIDTVERDLKLIDELGYKIKYVLETHVHADHITGSGIIRNKLGAEYVISKASEVECADILLEDGDELHFGELSIKGMSTPGHTDSCMSYLCEDMVFTGDALLIRGCGRTDFQQGDSKKLFNSVREKLFSLSDETRVFPAHDYNGHTHSSIACEKKFNPRLGLEKTLDEFTEIMNNLNLPHPKQIDRAVPGNKVCGLKDSSDLEATESSSGVPEVSVEQLVEIDYGTVNIIDVRSSEEFKGELGHIPESVMVELDDDFENKLRNFDRRKKTVFVCRSGNRSGKATIKALESGFEHPMNLVGGMIRWNELGHPVRKNEND